MLPMANRKATNCRLSSKSPVRKNGRFSYIINKKLKKSFVPYKYPTANLSIDTLHLKMPLLPYTGY
jgi:hypothetical protein